MVDKQSILLLALVGLKEYAKHDCLDEYILESYIGLLKTYESESGTYNKNIWIEIKQLKKYIMKASDNQ